MCVILASEAPRSEREIITLAQFPEEDLDIIQTVLESCGYDLETAVACFPDIKMSEDAASSSLSAASGDSDFVSDVQKGRKRKSFLPGVLVETRSLPKSSGVVPKHNTPEEIENKVDAILDMFPDADDNAIRHRLEGAVDLNSVFSELVNSLEAYSNWQVMKLTQGYYEELYEPKSLSESSGVLPKRHIPKR